MKAALCFVAVACCMQAASATDCTAIVISTTGNCINGAVLASDAVITECLTSICATMDVWSKAGYANTAKMVVGTGYDATCGPLDKDGDLGDAICAPAGGPTPPPFGPTPPPGPTTKPSGDSGSGDSDGGITGGVVFLIIFFVGGFVYFAAGFAYNFKMKELRGTEAIPNVAFWKDLPFLMKDGALFIKNKVTGKGSYTSV